MALEKVVVGIPICLHPRFKDIGTKGREAACQTLFPFPLMLLFGGYEVPEFSNFPQLYQQPKLLRK